MSIGNLHSRPTLLALIGIFIILFLMVRNVKGAMLLGMLITAVIGLIMGIIKYEGIMSLPPPIEPTFSPLYLIHLLENERDFDNCL